MIKLCEIYGGSKLYGLDTPQSDIDIRYIFMHDELGRTIGLERFEHLDGRTGNEDKFGFELRHYLNLLRKTNTQVVEIVFAETFIELHPLFKTLIIDNRLRLLDTVRMYKSLRGYIQGERRLANGERTGTLGGKRKEALDKYGFSYKNFVQLIRLCYCGIHFINLQSFPTNIQTANPALAKELLRLKTDPGSFKKEELNEWVDHYELQLENTFNDRDQSKDLKFDENLANEILLEFYFPILAKHYANLRLTTKSS